MDGKCGEEIVIVRAGLGKILTVKMKDTYAK